MNTVYTKTDKYALNLYGDNDPADLREGYNDSMHTIDDALETHRGRIEGVESRVFDIKAHKASDDPDYTNAWDRIMEKITDGGTIYFPSGIYHGEFRVTKPHVSVTGPGIVEGTIHVNVTSANTNPDMTLIDGLTIANSENPCIELHHTVGCVVTHCNLMSDGYGIVARDVPSHHQYVRQFNISDNHFSGKYGIWFKVDGDNPGKYYLGADGITPYIGYVLSFNGQNRIGNVSLTANKIMPYMILDGTVKFFA